jgi:heme-degrading monooxygenase HmoA
LQRAAAEHFTPADLRSASHPLNTSLAVLSVIMMDGGKQSSRLCPARLTLRLAGQRLVSMKEEQERNMIVRIWHGWTTPGNADQYEALLREEIFVGIHNRHIRGFKGIQLLRREVGGEVEFVTIMSFDSLEAVREFAGEDYEAAVVPAKARAVLSHFDERSQHYEIRAQRSGEG